MSAPRGKVRSGRVVPPLLGHRLWASSYDQAPNPLLALELRVTRALLGNISGSVLLDAACGTGRWMVEGHSRGARVIGFDLCQEMLAQAAMKANLPGRLIRADACRLPFPDGFADLSVCSFALAYIRQPRRLIAELARVVKAGGSIVISDLHPTGYGDGWTRSFRKQEMVYELESYPYSQGDLIAWGRSAGLELLEVQEPQFGQPEQQLFLQAKREKLLDQLQGHAAVLITHWKRSVNSS